MAVFPERAQSQKPVTELAERLGGALDETSAQAILALKPESPAPARGQEPADQANEGLLGAEAFAEYETYAQLRGLLAILRSRARLCLKPASPA